MEPMSMPRSGMWPQRQLWLQVFMTRGTITPHNVHCVTTRPKLPTLYLQSIPSNLGWCLAPSAATTTTTNTALNCRSDDKSNSISYFPHPMKNNWFPLPTSYSQWQQQLAELNPKETQTQLDIQAKARSEFETYLFLQSVSKTKHGSPLTTLQTQHSLGKEQYPDTIHKAVDILSQHHWDQNPNTIYFDLNLIYFYFWNWHVTARQIRWWHGNTLQSTLVQSSQQAPNTAGVCWRTTQNMCASP